MLFMSTKAKIDSVIVEVVKGDITKLSIEAIVNPANSLMVMGGGVAGAIKRAAGDMVEKEALKYAPVPVGLAIATSAGKLTNIKYVIHAPTMEKPAMRTNVDKVRKAVRAALSKARELGVSEIAFPGMGTGVGSLSYSVAAEAMVNEIKEFLTKAGSGSIRRIVLVAYGDELFKEFCKAVENIK